MANMTENKLKGKVIAYRVRFLPKKVDTRGTGVTITKDPKIGAFVEIRVDSKTYVVPSKGSEMVAGTTPEWNDPTDDPTPDLYKRVFNTLVDKHPRDSERNFTEFVTQRGKGLPLRRYELDE